MNWTEEQLAEYLKRHGTPAPQTFVGTASPPFQLPANEAGAFALGRLPAGTMNKTEAVYDRYLAELQAAGQILWRKFEAVKLRLADATFYTPDFAVLPSSGVLEMHEVKGFWQDDARVKIKVAASIYPFRFLAIKKIAGGWEREEFS